MAGGPLPTDVLLRMTAPRRAISCPDLKRWLEPPTADAQGPVGSQKYFTASFDKATRMFDRGDYAGAMAACRSLMCDSRCPAQVLEKARCLELCCDLKGFVCKTHKQLQRLLHDGRDNSEPSKKAEVEELQLPLKIAHNWSSADYVFIGEEEGIAMRELVRPCGEPYTLLLPPRPEHEAQRSVGKEPARNKDWTSRLLRRRMRREREQRIAATAEAAGLQQAPESEGAISITR